VDWDASRPAAGPQQPAAGAGEDRRVQMSQQAKLPSRAAPDVQDVSPLGPAHASGIAPGRDDERSNHANPAREKCSSAIVSRSEKRWIIPSEKVHEFISEFLCAIFSFDLRSMMRRSSFQLVAVILFTGSKQFSADGGRRPVKHAVQHVPEHSFLATFFSVIRESEQVRVLPVSCA